MGAFDESICDCSVCPMQCILKALEGEQGVSIVTNQSRFDNLTINEVKDFIVNTSVGSIAIKHISGLFYDSSLIPVEIPLKPIKQNTKGECACCETPMTEIMNRMKGQFVFIDGMGGEPGGTTQITDVGEGIFTFRSVEFPTIIGAGSTLVVTSVGPPGSPP
ncbi:hypothetical protein [Chengkuizengella axinellae]|uniref:Uncharacterized protein n=1 Tax=Chengkuizengella axinellae TaxID=3064388 RepID=A0ABT9ITJ9_9BACL|nr:hypothetical protein [Chengkuizengella sp. 2205SS18-9]MDP5272663.1 hypothetical protein [Chengkuizengella sp. 2205SS18-9]